MVTKTEAALTAYHFGALVVVLTDINHNITRVPANFKEALQYFNTHTNCQECQFTGADKEADRTPTFALHMVQPEANP